MSNESWGDGHAGDVPIDIAQAYPGGVPSVDRFYDHQWWTETAEKARQEWFVWDRNLGVIGRDVTSVDWEYIWKRGNPGIFDDGHLMAQQQGYNALQTPNQEYYFKVVRAERQQNMQADEKPHMHLVHASPQNIAASIISQRPILQTDQVKKVIANLRKEANLPDIHGGKFANIAAAGVGISLVTK